MHLLSPIVNAFAAVGVLVTAFFLVIGILVAEDIVKTQSRRK